jgi:hypothetical protein
MIGRAASIKVDRGLWEMAHRYTRRATYSSQIKKHNILKIGVDR